MKAGLYRRVSTLEQTKYGYSIEAQSEKMEAYCKAMNYDVYATYTDDGFTGATLNRPAVHELINAIKRREIDIVIIYKLDRLSRDVRDTLNLVDLFIESGVQLYSLSEQIDLTSPFGRAALTMSATFSAMERDVIRQRSIMGKEQRIKSGKMMSSGKSGAPFGYTAIPKEKRFEVNEKEAEAVREIFHLYVYEGFTLRKLYPYMREKYGFPVFNSPMCCKSILKRPTYAGYFKYKNELYKGTNFEPIISYSLYLQAQEKMKQNKTERKYETRPYLLTGLLFCGKCGSRYVGKRSRRYSQLVSGGRNFHEDKYYGCNSRIKRDKNYTAQKCDNLIFPVAVLDDEIERRVVNLEFTEFAAGETNAKVFDALFSEIAANEEKKEKLLDLYLEEKISKEVFEKRTEECDKLIKKDKKILEEEQEKMKEQPPVSISYLKERQEAYPSASDEEKRKTLFLLIKHITIDDNEITIKWRVK